MREYLEYHQNRCEGKRAYASKKDAKLVAKDQLSRQSVKLRVYECPFCLKWHITHHKDLGVNDRIKKNMELAEWQRVQSS